MADNKKTIDAETRNIFAMIYTYYVKHHEAKTEKEWTSAADDMDVLIKKHGERPLMRLLLLATYEGIAKEQADRKQREYEEAVRKENATPKQMSVWS